MTLRDSARRKSQALKDQVFLFVLILLVLWGVEVIDQYVISDQSTLDVYGIRPRSAVGLWGILFSPFLHRGFEHLAANSIPLVILGWLVMVTTGRDRVFGRFFSVSAIIVVVGGLGTWLLGETHTAHVGASGVIFGYLGFLLIRAYFRRSLGSIVVALAVALFYGGLVFGVLPGQAGISWEAHLSGFVGGGLAARLIDRDEAVREVPVEPSTPTPHQS